jgi:diaminopimelate epimerase
MSCAKGFCHMTAIAFTKMNGSGNDFILIDHRSGFLKDVLMPEFVRTVCRRRESIGADGLILIETSEVADFKWRFYNADGSEAEMCGNGGRCAARFAVQKGIAGSKLTFETVAGLIQAEVRGRTVVLQLSPPGELLTRRTIAVDGNPVSLGSINTGVPHVVIPVEDLEAVPVKTLGRKIRFHEEFQPAGTNVNFIRIADPFHIAIRTYERGVEDETLACGTGSVASVLVCGALGQVKSPVQVRTKGGEVLTVHFAQRNADSFSRVSLEGDTCLVFEGTLGEDVWDQYKMSVSG